MNDTAQAISKNIFKNLITLTTRFINSSIFDFDDKSLYNTFDIVHCREF